MASTSLPMRPLKRSTRPLVCGVRGRVAVFRAQCGTGLGKGGGEATAVVGQDMRHAEGESSGGLVQEGNGAAFGLVVLDGEVDRARAAVDGDIEVALAWFAIGGLQLGQRLDVEMH